MVCSARVSRCETNASTAATALTPSGCEATASTTATALTLAQAQMFTSMLAPVNYTNMTQAQILQMHNQFLHDVLEIPLLRYRTTVSPPVMPVNSQSAQVVSSPKYFTFDYVLTLKSCDSLGAQAATSPTAGPSGTEALVSSFGAWNETMYTLTSE